MDDAEKFCAWYLSDFRYKDEKTASMIPSKVLPVGACPEPCRGGKTIMMAPTAGFYTDSSHGKN